MAVDVHDASGDGTDRVRASLRRGCLGGLIHTIDYVLAKDFGMARWGQGCGAVPEVASGPRSPASGTAVGPVWA